MGVGSGGHGLWPHTTMGTSTSLTRSTSPSTPTQCRSASRRARTLSQTSDPYWPGLGAEGRWSCVRDKGKDFVQGKIRKLLDSEVIEMNVRIPTWSVLKGR